MELQQESNNLNYSFAIDSFFEATNIDNDFPFYVDPFEKLENNQQDHHSLSGSYVSSFSSNVPSVSSNIPSLPSTPQKKSEIRLNFSSVDKSETIENEKIKLNETQKDTFLVCNETIDLEKKKPRDNTKRKRKDQKVVKEKLKKKDSKNLKNQIALKEKEAENMREEFQEKQKRLDDQTKRLQNMEKIFQDMERELIETKDDLKQANKQIKIERKEYLDNQENLEKNINELKSKLREMENKEKEESILLQSTIRMLNDMNDIVEKFQNDNNLMKNTIYNREVSLKISFDDLINKMSIEANQRQLFLNEIEKQEETIKLLKDELNILRKKKK